MSAASFDAPAADRTLGPAAYRDEDFPGCESFPLPASELDGYEGRLEFWDGVTETAWKVCEPTSIQHEEPSRLLVQMAGQFAMLRGSRIACFGSADLVRRDASGHRCWLMQADEVLYLHPDRVRLAGPAIDVDRDPLPEVVLEVDHTTDVRRRKLEVYKESGFPEIWVLVPWEASVRAPGLAIHVRRGDFYHEESSSRAFPGWTAQEIHLALTEAPMTGPAWRALERTALAMGAREGTTPQHDPLMASESARVRARSHAQGHREGRAQGHREGHADGHREGRAQGHREGHREGHADGHMDAVADLLASRGIELTPDMAQYRALCGGIAGKTVMGAALACTDEADFRRRVRALSDVHGRDDATPPHRPAPS